MTDLMFRDRDQAGRDLATVVSRRTLYEPIVLALPPGGVPVASAIAETLHAPLDVLVVRKFSAPQSPHRTLGALATDGSKAFNRDLVPDLAGVEDADLTDAITVIRAELRQRERVYRRDRPFPDVANRDVILVSDGMNSGVAMLAAVRAVQRMRPRRVYVAVPAASRMATRRLKGSVDDVICLETAEAFFGVGSYYMNFDSTSDEDICRLLDRDTSASATGADVPDTSSLH